MFIFLFLKQAHGIKKLQAPYPTRLKEETEGALAAGSSEEATGEEEFFSSPGGQLPCWWLTLCGRRWRWLLNGYAQHRT